MQQKRFVLALIISTVILFGWGYFFPPQTPPQNDPNNPASQTPAASPSPTPAATATATPQTTPTPQSATATSANATQQKTLLVKTPLYDAKFDSRGAVTTSWIIKKNKDTQRALNSVSGTRDNPQPLQLISQEGLKREKREAPLRLVTGDGALDALLESNNYQITGVEGEGSELTLDFATGEKRVEFSLRDEATGLDVSKVLIFSADRYDIGIETKMTRGGQPLPKAQLMVGPSIGDQGVPQYSFYSVAPEGVAVVNGETHRLLGPTIESDQEGWLFKSTRPGGPNYYGLNGEVDWAGVGDTYFAMMAVPSKRMSGLEFRTTKYQHEANGVKEDRYLLNAFVPIPTDGSRTQLYVGPKDHDLLTGASEAIGQTVSRSLDLKESIDYGLFSTISRPLTVPILKSIQWLYKLTNSYGLAIILFTIVIYSLFFPLKWRSSKSMKKAQKLAPRMKELQEKIKGMKQDDPKLKELQMEQLRLMKEGNPLGGCLPLLIQMPFLFALYRAITISIEFRQASFLWIPDLSAPEPYMIHLLPILMAGSMVVLQLITPAPSADPLQRKMMAIGMPLFMLYILWSAPSGLLVYWLVGNIVGFGQQFLINRLTKSEDDEPPPEEKKVGVRPPKKLKTARAS
ncbi:MAG: membrane protein insertase YidC [Pyrinomonadaceae bacterium]|nr:membrane protein insertase YidC [Pyrinomonadaceae bacterium]